MKTRYHEGIFYPIEETELDALVGVEMKKSEASRAIIVPHQNLQKCAPLLREAFSYAGSPKRVIVFSPLHSPRLERDRDEVFFEGQLLPESNMFLLGLKEAEYYAEEEAAGEIVLPFIEHNLPEAKWAVVYTDIKTAKDAKKLSALIEKENDGETLFVISSNLSEVCRDAEETKAWKKAAVRALEEGSFLLDQINKNRIHLCGGGTIDALSRAMGGKWKMVADEEDDTITAHAAFVRTNES